VPIQQKLAVQAVCCELFSIPKGSFSDLREETGNLAAI
jgi:uncharacterized metal-binding protein